MPTHDAESNEPSGLIADIVNLTNREHQKMWEAMEQKGGWEGWAQVELAYYINNEPGLDHSYVAERELLAYEEPKQRIDIWAESLEEREPNMGIELKCESHYQDVVTDTGLPARLMKDMKKVNKGLKKEYAGKYGTWVYVVGITTNPNDLKGYDEEATQGIPVWYAQTPSKMHWVVWWGRFL